jgi:hypothetical protein
LLDEYMTVFPVNVIPPCQCRDGINFSDRWM